jgi:two-component system OmpR family response regulator
MAENHILIVDDDKGIRDVLGEFLVQQGFEVSLAKDGGEMKTVLDKGGIDLIILDIMMPGEDGLRLCRQLRVSSSIPIIMLTAIGEEMDRILGLEMGADDYLSKPFNPRELLARIRSILRRASGKPELETEPMAHSYYKFQGWRLDRAARKLFSPENLEISLSTGEFNLLMMFLERPQMVLSRDYLLDLTKNRSASAYDRSIDIQISRLRQKIEPDQKNPNILKTVRGGGYVLACDVEME